MNHELYIFGSIIRGEVTLTSDVDVLVIPLDQQARESYPPSWSIYSFETLKDYYKQGRLFAWHLHREARCLYSPLQTNLLAQIGEPAPYSTDREDVDDLYDILIDALSELRNGTESPIYEIGIVHAAVRDIAMSASWKIIGFPCFSRESPYHIPVDFPLSKETYHAAMLARHHSTRGVKIPINPITIANEILAAPLEKWVNEVRSYL